MSCEADLKVLSCGVELRGCSKSLIIRYQNDRDPEAYNFYKTSALPTSEMDNLSNSCTEKISACRELLLVESS